MALPDYDFEQARMSDEGCPNDPPVNLEAMSFYELVTYVLHELEAERAD